jgi:hypothetical protein
MPHILTHDPVRDLPLHRDGFNAGQDLGLRIALDVIVAVGVAQEQRAAPTSPPTPANAHTAAELRAVADRLAFRFRQ